jgi:hypothetical protein
MSNNNYSEDHQFGTEEYQPLLDNYFYPNIAGGSVFELRSIRRFDSKSYHDMLRQRKFKMDLEVELLPYVWFDIEEKVVRWPQNGKPHTAFYYETESCSLPGLITPGWMRDSEAECLMYAFEIPARGLDIYFSKQFQEIKDRFWQAMEKDRNCFHWHRNKGKNESQGRLVPIGLITRRFPQIERYHLHLDGTCKRVEFNASFLPCDTEASA